MKRVIIVGAGATLAEALPSNPRRAERPPLDATFFEMCRLAKLPGRRAISDYMHSRFGVNPFLGGYGMEEVFNLIYSEAAAVPPPPGCLEAYSGLVRLYARAIGSTTNPLLGTSRSGVGALLRNFYLHATDPDLVFVTFNQDLVIEKAIEAARATGRYSAIPWSLGPSYRVAFVDCYPIAGRPSFRHVVAEDSIPILKLHGSLNWLYNVRSGEDPKNYMRQPAGDLHCLNSRNVIEGLQYRRGRAVDVIPLVVPPIYEKASRYSQALAPVWTSAASEISTCDSLVFFGYSLPVADVWARTTLRAAIHANSRLKDISIIDPSPDAAMRIRDIAGTRGLHHYLDAGSFVKTDRVLI